MSYINAITSPSPAVITYADATGNLQLQTAGTTALTIDSIQNANFAGYVNAPNTFGYRNRVINGGMSVDQRGSASAPTNTNATYSVDRWLLSKGGSGVFSLGQSTTAPAGFKNSLVATVTTAASITSGDYYDIIQFIEGLNIADLGWGTATAAPVTMSFWVRSSVSGVYSFEVRNAALNRSITYNYTITNPNVWQQVTQTIPGDTTGTWATDNTTGICLLFPLATGSNYTTSTTGAWQAANYNASTTATTSWINTVGNTFYLTGVQFEKGTVATPFDFRSYGQELSLCQRYYEQERTGGTSGKCFSSSDSVFASQTVSFMAQKRTSPTITFWDINNNINQVHVQYVGSGGGSNVTGVTPNSNLSGFYLTKSGIGPDKFGAMYFYWSAFAELT